MSWHIVVDAYKYTADLQLVPEGLLLLISVIYNLFHVLITYLCASNSKLETSSET